MYKKATVSVLDTIIVSPPPIDTLTTRILYTNLS